MQTEEQQANKTLHKLHLHISASAKNLIQFLVFGLSVLSLPGLIMLFLVIPKVQAFSKFLYNHPSHWSEKMTMSYSYLFFKRKYLYISCVIFGNMAVNSFFTALFLENFPTSTGSYLVSLSPILQDVLQLCSFSSFLCFYLILLYVRHYAILILAVIMGFLFVQFTGESLTACNFWSGSTLLGIFTTFEYMLIDLFNMFLSLPGNLMCFIPAFQPFMIQVFVQDWHGKTHIFRLPQSATVSDLENQISIKFKLPHSYYWLSGPKGEPMKNNDILIDQTTINIRGRLIGGKNMCCIKGCSEERKISCLTGVQYMN